MKIELNRIGDKLFWGDKEVAILVHEGDCVMGTEDFFYGRLFLPDAVIKAIHKIAFKLGYSCSMLLNEDIEYNYNQPCDVSRVQDDDVQMWMRWNLLELEVRTEWEMRVN